MAALAGGCGGGGDMEPVSPANAPSGNSAPASYSLAVNVSGAGTVTSSPTGISCGSDCAEEFSSGTNVTLTATPATGYAFGGWSASGVSCPATASCTIPVTQNRNVTATFVQNTYALTVSVNGSGSVTSSPAGINCGSDCNQDYASGTSVTLSASPASGYSFSGWSGSGISCSGTGSCTVSMTGARNVTATFSPIAATTYVLQINRSGNGTVTSSPAGISCGSDCSESYVSGTSVTLNAVPASGNMFTGWSGGGCSGSGACTVSMTAARTVSATFAPSTYSLTVAVSSSGSVTSSPAGINCGSDCTENYNSGTSVTLSASAASGYSFSGWSGSGISCSGTGACTVSMTASRSVTATFTVLPTYSLTVSRSGSGTITSSPAGINCGSDCSEGYLTGTSVTLSAAPASGYSFSGWGGACNGASATCIVAMTAARSVSATFTQDSGGTGSVTLTWEAPNQNIDDSCLTDLAGYEIHRGPSAGNYTVSETVLVNAVSCVSSGTSNACGVIPTCTYTVNNLPAGTWYFSLQAFDAVGEHSSYSNVASKTTP